MKQAPISPCLSTLYLKESTNITPYSRYNLGKKGKKLNYKDLFSGFLPSEHFWIEPKSREVRYSRLQNSI